MDPLSPVASVLAVLGAAAATARAIDKLRRIRKLPGDFSSLLAEVADLHHVLQECEWFAQQQKAGAKEKEPGPDIGHGHRRLSTYAEQAMHKLTELEELTKAHTSPNGFSSATELKAFWTCMVHGKTRVNRFRDELRDIRLGLSTALDFNASSTLSKLDGKVHDISTQQAEILQAVRDLSLHAKSAALQPPSYQESESSDIMTRRKPTVGTVSRPVPTANFKTDSSASRCQDWCSCQCHRPSSLHSWRAVKDVFGALSLIHNGLPMMTKPCNQKTCRRASGPSISMSYRFPKAFTQRLFVLSFSLSGLAGPEIRVKLPRVVEWTSPVWHYAVEGNVKALSNLFRSGLASPWDVSPLGGNLLHYATDHWSADICRLLLDAGVDPLVQDDFKNDPVTIAWERVLSGKMSDNDGSVVASMFKDTDHLTTRGFSVVHKIVLGLVSKDLDLELQCSTEDIDSLDTRGRTPLSWAVARGDESSTHTLLTHGADANIADMCLFTPLHYVSNAACAQLLLDHGASLSAVNEEGQTPLYTACRNIGSASLTDFLLSAGADVNAADSNRQTPLHVAMSNVKYTPFIDILVDAGADINARNSSGDTPLRFAVLNNMHALLQRMLDMPTDFSGFNNYGQSFSHAIACFSDAETVRLITLARPASLVPDIETLDVSGKTSLDYLNERLDTIEDGGGAAPLKEAFERLVEALRGPGELGREAEDISGYKLEVEVRVAEMADNTEELFHDAVEAI